MVYAQNNTKILEEVMIDFILAALIASFGILVACVVVMFVAVVAFSLVMLLGPFTTFVIFLILGGFTIAYIERDKK